MNKDTIANYFNERISRNLLRDFAKYLGLSTGALKNEIVWRLVENGYSPDQLKQYCIQVGREFSELDMQESLESIIIPQISQEIENTSMNTKSLTLASGPNHSRPRLYQINPLDPRQKGNLMMKKIPWYLVILKIPSALGGVSVHLKVHVIDWTKVRPNKTRLLMV